MPNYASSPATLPLERSRLAIIIATMNRPDFLIRQLAYYADVGYRHAVYVGDSSETGYAGQVTEGIRRLQDRVNIVYMRLPGLNDSQATSELLGAVQEPYAAISGDDDFLVPASLERCARFLDGHPDFSTAHGIAIQFGVGTDGAYGEMAWSCPYNQRPVEHTTARERLMNLLGNYFVTNNSVHRIQDFQREIDTVKQITDNSFRELLGCCLSIIRGKAKELEGLHLIRQAHGRRYVRPDIYDWVTSLQWLPSYEVFRNRLSEELVREDGISSAEAREVVKQAFWRYLANVLRYKWDARYNQTNGGGSYSRLRRMAHSIPGAQQAWGILRSLGSANHNALSLPTLLGPSSVFRADFMPIYRVVSEES